VSSIALNASTVGEVLAARAAAGQQVSEVFLVACGGSLVDLYVSRYFLASETRRLRVDTYTANEFVHATPKVLGVHSAVIMCTHSGGTAEAVAAARIAQSAGAFTMTLTHNKAASISAFSDVNIIYDWGDESRVADNPMAIALALCVEILQQVEGCQLYDDFRAALGRIDDVVAAAREKVSARARLRGKVR